MGKVILASLLAGSLGGAAFVTVGQTYYSSSFQYDFCPGGAFKVTPSLGNIWHWEGDVPAGAGASVAVMVDFNGDGVMDTESPDVRVCITDMQLNGQGAVAIDDSTGTRWRMEAAITRDAAHFTTPVVLPVNSTLTLRQEASGFTLPTRIRLIGRVVNI